MESVKTPKQRRNKGAFKRRLEAKQPDRRDYEAWLDELYHIRRELKRRFRNDPQSRARFGVLYRRFIAAGMPWNQAIIEAYQCVLHPGRYFECPPTEAVVAAESTPMRPVPKRHSRHRVFRG